MTLERRTDSIGETAKITRQMEDRSIEMSAKVHTTTTFVSGMSAAQREFVSASIWFGKRLHECKTMKEVRALVVEIGEMRAEFEESLNLEEDDDGGGETDGDDSHVDAGD